MPASLYSVSIRRTSRGASVRAVLLARSSCYEASGEIRSQGIDFELQGALTDNWQVGGGYTYARTHTTKDEANPQNVNKQFDTDTPEHLSN